MVKGGMAWNFYISFFYKEKKPAAHGNHKSCKKIIKKILQASLLRKKLLEMDLILNLIFQIFNWLAKRSIRFYHHFGPHRTLDKVN